MGWLRTFRPIIGTRPRQRPKFRHSCVLPIRGCKRTLAVLRGLRREAMQAIWVGFAGPLGLRETIRNYDNPTGRCRLSIRPIRTCLGMRRDSVCDRSPTVVPTPLCFPNGASIALYRLPGRLEAPCPTGRLLSCRFAAAAEQLVPCPLGSNTVMAYRLQIPPTQRRTENPGSRASRSLQISTCM